MGRQGLVIKFSTALVCSLLMCSCAGKSSVSDINCETTGLSCLKSSADVALQTNKGNIILRLDGKNAPLTAGNFVELVRKGAYNNTIFHRVVRTPLPFVVQGGDPLSANSKTPASLYGTGNYVDPATGEARYIPLEFRLKSTNKFVYGQEVSPLGPSSQPILTHQRGAVAMARSADPNSASAQFYIALEALPELDGRYAVFGRVVQGMEVVDEIQQGDRILRADVVH